MSKTTKAAVQRALKAAGLDLDLWYDHAACQWVFIGHGTENWGETGSSVYRLSDMTPQKWVEMAIYMREQGV